MPRPIVGVTGGALTAERQRAQHALRSALHAAGCVPVLLRPDEGAVSLARVHGLVLPGGGDIDPRSYGHEPAAEIRDPDPERERFEIAIARDAVAAGLPVLGICLGAQILTVALGGTLHQHVPDLPGAVAHEGDGVTHDVRLDPASRLARILGAASLTTNSRHHQAPASLPPMLEAVARTADGVVEGVEGPGFTIGVGWHPETMSDEPGRRLLAAFVAAANDRSIAHPIRP
ncbi:MAG: gamma-glutamyl-gamma-aminobutyrate hydrolase family protein [Actinomycetota bacterium]